MAEAVEAEAGSPNVSMQQPDAAAVGVLMGRQGEVLFLLPEAPVVASSVPLAEASVADNGISAPCLYMAPNEASIAFVISSSNQSSLLPVAIERGQLLPH